MVVSNTSPLNYLVQIGAVDLLSEVYGEIHVPPPVIEDLCDAAAPSAVRDWASAPPDWLRIEAGTPVVGQGLPHLHRGEAAAIALALEAGASLLLIDDLDDLDGRDTSRELGLTVMGTLGFLDAAATRGLADFHALVDALLGTNLRAPRSLVEALRARHR